MLLAQGFVIHQIDVIDVILDPDSVETIIIEELDDSPMFDLNIFAQAIVFLVIVNFVISGSTVQQKD